MNQQTPPPELRPLVPPWMIAMAILTFTVTATATRSSASNAIFVREQHPAENAKATRASFLSRLQGEWIGKGQLMKRDCRVELRVEQVFGRPVFSLSWRSVGAGSAEERFEGVAVYEDRGDGALIATWWDSTGAKHAITASASDSAMTSLWGENGRTTYTLRPSGQLDVVDSVRKKDGSWGEFGRSTLEKRPPR